MADMTALEWRISELKKQYPSWENEWVESKSGYYIHHDIMNTFEGQRAKLLCYSFCSTIGGVYFITDQTRTLTKIGMSRNIAKRYIQHMEAAKQPLILMGYIPCGALQLRAIERMAHLIFKDLNTCGENSITEMFFNEKGKNGYPCPKNTVAAIKAIDKRLNIAYVDCDLAFWNIDSGIINPLEYLRKETIEKFQDKHGHLSEAMIESLTCDFEDYEGAGWE